MVVLGSFAVVKRSMSAQLRLDDRKLRSTIAKDFGLSDADGRAQPPHPASEAAKGVAAQ
jgi:hypothetical protein